MVKDRPNGVMAIHKPGRFGSVSGVSHRAVKSCQFFGLLARGASHLIPRLFESWVGRTELG